MSFHIDLFLTGTFLDGTFTESAGNTRLDEILTELEKHPQTKNIWKDGLWKSGIWDHTPLDEVLDRLEDK